MTEANIHDFILNLYPSREAAKAHAALLKDLGSFYPIKVTWSHHGVNVRHHSYALHQLVGPPSDLERELRKAWPRLNIWVGVHHPDMPLTKNDAEARRLLAKSREFP